MLVVEDIVGFFKIKENEAVNQSSFVLLKVDFWEKENFSRF